MYHKIISTAEPYIPFATENEHRLVVIWKDGIGLNLEDIQTIQPNETLVRSFIYFLNQSNHNYTLVQKQLGENPFYSMLWVADIGRQVELSFL